MLCAICQEPRETGHSYCRACARKRTAARRTPYATWSPAEQARHLAYVAASRYLKRNKLPRGPCEICGLEQAYVYLPDPAQRFNIRWRCRMHKEHPGVELQEDPLLQ